MNNKQVQTTETLYMSWMTAKLIKIIMHAFSLSWDLLYNTEKLSLDLKSGWAQMEVLPKNNAI